MWGRAKSTDGTISSNVGRDARLKGTLKDRGSIRLDGHFEGTVEADGTVFIGEGAMVEADIKARAVVIGGKVVGDIDSQGRVELYASGSLEGKVVASDLTIAEGACFNGECRMTPQGRSRAGAGNQSAKTETDANVKTASASKG